MGISARSSVLTLVIAISVVMAGAPAAQAVTLQDQVTSSTNAQRTAVAMRPLVRDPALDAVAQAWADEMSQSGNFKHSTKEWRAARMPAGWDTHGENIAFGFSSAADVMGGWMASQGHKENILRSSYTRIGVGYVAAGRYWVQIFGGYKQDRAPGSAPAPSIPVTRITGPDRYSVANTIAKTAYPDGADVVFVASGLDYPDALSASPAAIKLRGPLVLSQPTGLPNSTRGTIASLRPKTIVVVGGTASISDAVLEKLRELSPVVVRIAGADRYEVSRALARYAFPERGTGTAYVATGSGFPDALSAGSAAGSVGAPVLLVKGSQAPVDERTRNLVGALGVRSIKIAGGPATVTPGVADSLSTAAPEVHRLSGIDRFEASVSINADAYKKSTTAYLATGYNYPDALAGSVLAGSKKAPLFVVRATCIPLGVLAQFDALGVTQVVLLGGPATLSPEVESLVPCGS